MAGRIRYLDIAKGIGILAVIIGHTAIRLASGSRLCQLVVAVCFTFHMPLFFILSGYFLDVRSSYPLGREARRLLVPYAITAACVVALVTVRSALTGGDVPTAFSRWLSAAAFGSGGVRSNALWPQHERIGAIWFLLALFWARAIVWLSSQTRWPFLAVAASFVVGLLSSRVLFLPLSLQPGMCAAPFVLLGARLRERGLLEELLRSKVVMGGCLALWGLSIVGYRGFGMEGCNYGASVSAFVLNMVGAVAGTLSVLGISRVIDELDADLASRLGRVGTLTLLMLCVHLGEDDVIWPDLNAWWISSGAPFPVILMVESVIRCAFVYLVSLGVRRALVGKD